MLLEMLQAAVGGESRGKSEPKYETRKLKEIINIQFYSIKQLYKEILGEKEKKRCVLSDEERGEEKKGK